MHLCAYCVCVYACVCVCFCVYMCFHMCRCMCVCMRERHNLEHTFHCLFTAVWPFSNSWHSSHLRTIWSWSYQVNLHCYSLWYGINRSLPRRAVNLVPISDLIVQDRSITMRPVPFHRQSVFIRRRKKSHSTHWSWYCRKGYTILITVHQGRWIKCLT